MKELMTKLKFVAHLVEHQTDNLSVVGSSPTKFSSHKWKKSFTAPLSLEWLRGLVGRLKPQFKAQSVKLKIESFFNSTLRAKSSKFVEIQFDLANRESVRMPCHWGNFRVLATACKGYFV